MEKRVRVLVIGAASLSGYLALARLDAVNGAGPVAWFLAVMTMQFGLMLAAYRALRHSRHAGWWIFGGALAFRLALIPAGIPAQEGMWASLKRDWSGAGSPGFERFQLFDDDVWRYLWDGHVAASRRDVYERAPADPELDGLAEEERWEEIRSNVNYRGHRTVYPPLAQAAFRLAYQWAPGSVAAMKLVVTGFDLGAVAVLMVMLRRLEQPGAWAVFYAWNPLVIKVFAGSAHIDSLLVLLLTGSALAAIGRRPWVAGGLMGGAILAKLSPLILLPLLWRYLGWRAVAAAVLVSGSGYAGIEQGAMFEALGAFAREWRFNAGPFTALAWMVGDSTARMVSGMVIAVAGITAAGRQITEGRDYLTRMSLVLGAVLIAGPVVMPWYVTGLLPVAIAAGRWAGVWFSFCVLLAFLVMIDQKEYPAVLAVEYGVLAAGIWYFGHRRRLVLADELQAGPRRRGGIKEGYSR